MTSQTAKKKRRTEDDDISPSPLRRKRQVIDSSTSTSIDQVPKQQQDIPTISKDSIQIFSWNINGISHLLPKTQKSIKAFFTPPSLQGEGETSSSAPLKDFLERHHWPQYVGLQEMKISPKNEATRRAVEKAANGDESLGYKAYFSLPQDMYNATGWGGKVYGACTLIRDDVASLPGQTTKEVDWDLEGRVLVTELPSMKLVIINGTGSMVPWR